MIVKFRMQLIELIKIIKSNQIKLSDSLARASIMEKKRE